MAEDEAAAKYKEKLPKTVSFHCTEEEYAELIRIRNGRRAKKPGMNFRELVFEMVNVLQKEGYYK